MAELVTVDDLGELLQFFSSFPCAGTQRQHEQVRAALLDGWGSGFRLCLRLHPIVFWTGRCSPNLCLPLGVCVCVCVSRAATTNPGQMRRAFSKRLHHRLRGQPAERFLLDVSGTIDHSRGRETARLRGPAAPGSGTGPVIFINIGGDRELTLSVDAPAC